VGQGVRHARARGQGGFTLIEAVLSVVVVSTAIVSIAAGLLGAARIDNRTNERQRANLALTTFVENLDHVQSSCPAVSTPAPATGASNGASHATALLSATAAEPEVAEWIDRGMVFSITRVEYARWDVAAGAEDFTAACNTPPPTNPNPLRPRPYYPVIRVTVTACQGGVGASTCAGDAVVVQTQSIERGGRNG
jgi:Tfp pilus assembly protein PilV